MGNRTRFSSDPLSPDCDFQFRRIRRIKFTHQILSLDLIRRNIPLQFLIQNIDGSVGYRPAAYLLDDSVDSTEGSQQCEPVFGLDRNQIRTVHPAYLTVPVGVGQRFSQCKKIARRFPQA